MSLKPHVCGETNPAVCLRLFSSSQQLAVGRSFNYGRVRRLPGQVEGKDSRVLATKWTRN